MRWSVDETTARGGKREAEVEGRLNGGRGTVRGSGGGVRERSRTRRGSEDRKVKGKREERGMNNFSYVSPCTVKER